MKKTRTEEEGALKFGRNEKMWECHCISPEGDSKLIGSIHMAVIATDDDLIRDQFVELMKRSFLFVIQKTPANNGGRSFQT